MDENTAATDQGSSLSPHHMTRPEDRVPFGQKMALSFGAFTNTTGTQILQVMALPIFQIVLGCHPMLVGLAMTIPRLWDAITDPVMGYISDNHRSPRGRRRPFIVTGAYLMALSFVFFWLVPRSWSPTFSVSVSQEQAGATASQGEDEESTAAENDQTSDSAAEDGTAKQEGEKEEVVVFTESDYKLFAWLLVGSLIFYTCYTIYAVPLVSLSYEMTPDYHERTRVMAYWGAFTMAGNLLINWYYPLTEQKWLFSDPLQGARWVSLVTGTIVFVGLGVLPGIFTRERLYHTASKQEKVRLINAVVETIGSRNMLMLLGMTLSLAFVGAMAAALALYIVIFHVCGGDREFGSVLNAFNGVGFQIVGFATIPLLTLAATRFGKRRMMFVVLAMAALGGVAKWFIYTPDMPYLLLLDPILSGPIWVALSVLVPSMMADLCDVDEYAHGKRREGVFGAVFSWIQKVGFSLTFLFSGLAVWLSGFDEQLGAAQPEGTMLAMRLCFAGFSVLAMLIGIGFLCFYNVSEKRAYEVRAVLEERRGKV